jgi:hypothetical protein
LQPTPDRVPQYQSPPNSDLVPQCQQSLNPDPVSQDEPHLAPSNGESNDALALRQVFDWNQKYIMGSVVGYAVASDARGFYFFGLKQSFSLSSKPSPLVLFFTASITFLPYKTAVGSRHNRTRHHRLHPTDRFAGSRPGLSTVGLRREKQTAPSSILGGWRWRAGLESPRIQCCACYLTGISPVDRARLKTGSTSRDP